MASSKASKSNVNSLSSECLLEPELFDDLGELVCSDVAVDEALQSELPSKASFVSVKLPLRPDDNVDSPLSSSDSSSLLVKVVLPTVDIDPSL